MKTANSFTEDPPWLVQRQGDAFPGRKRRLYKSGDLGRYNADGSIQFLERKDLQKKTRGQRIEVGDIESHLRQLLPTEMSVAVDVIVPIDSQDVPKLAGFLRINKDDTDSAEPLTAISVRQEKCN